MVLKVDKLWSNGQSLQTSKKETFLNLYGVLFQILFFSICNPCKISLSALTVGTTLGYSVREPPILGVVGKNPLGSSYPYGTHRPPFLL